MVIPLLNGMAHYNKLDEQFGKEKVIGGLCYIEATLDSEGQLFRKVRYICLYMVNDPGKNLRES